MARTNPLDATSRAAEMTSPHEESIPPAFWAWAVLILCVFIVLAVVAWLPPGCGPDAPRGPRWFESKGVG